MQIIRTRLSEYIIPYSVVMGAIILTLFGHWEPTHESFGLWTFARVFAEGGGFLIPDRSPLYTLYLNGFRWLGYPNSVTVEYVITSFIFITALVVLFRPYVGLWMSVFAAILWLPILQTYSEPPVQKLALACSCWAIIARQGKSTRFQWALSYALMGLAYMFRVSYVIFILVFAIWDMRQLHKQRGRKALFRAVRPQLSDWPIALVVILLVCFSTMQSSHRWNNAWYSTTTWFPGNGKKLVDASLLQAYNTWYNRNELKGQNKDMYFSNKELFGGASTFWGAVSANPRFIIESTVRNLWNVPVMAAKYPILGGLLALPFLSVILIPAIVILILYGAFQAAQNENMILFVIASVFLIGATGLGLVKRRYMIPYIPVLILSASWYGPKIRDVILPAILRSPRSLLGGGLTGAALIFLKLAFKENPSSVKLYTAVTVALMLIVLAVSGYLARSKSQQWLSSLRRLMPSLAIPLTFVLFSNILWVNLIRDLANDALRGELRVLEYRADPDTGLASLKASFKELEPLVQKSKGILTLQYTFVGAFMNVPLNRVYDIWEIPPYGHLGNSIYSGLHPNRIDCILVTYFLAESEAHRFRYQNYIKPYIKHLQQLGAKTYEIQGFGKAIIMPNAGI